MTKLEKQLNKELEYLRDDRDRLRRDIERLNNDIHESDKNDYCIDALRDSQIRERYYLLQKTGT